jgi:ADP-ribosylglycohydrolase
VSDTRESPLHTVDDLSADYEERVYAGVLGKIIGVYLGRPFEGWTYERIMRELGEVTGYVNDRLDLPFNNHLLVVTDDDISGTLVFPRVLDDLAAGEPLDPQAVGRTWLNELIPGRTVLWWGGLGNSTEHTAYLRLRSGVPAPRSGSAELNGRVVAEQVGAQIFCEGFAMTCPADPAGAADLVQRAASVSHDGEALQAARMVGAMVASAFVAADVETMLDEGLSQVQPGCLIADVISDVRRWAERGDWHETRARIDKRYGYHRYGGNCHVVPNHAVVIAAIAHSGGDFGRAMTVVNTCGWDTDSNAGDVGSVMGVFAGLAGLTSSVDYRGPLADRLYLPTAAAGGVITDAAQEALRLAAHGRIRAGRQPLVPKDGARFHFTFPGSVQGFQIEEGDGFGGAAQVPGADGQGRLRIAVDRPGSLDVVTPTFIPPEARDMPGYGLMASPTLYPGQTVRAVVDVPEDAAALTAQLVIKVSDVGCLDDALQRATGPATTLSPGTRTELSWTVPDLGGQPVTFVGLAVESSSGAGELLLDRLDWSGQPTVSFSRPARGGLMWQRAWVDAVTRVAHVDEPFRLIQDAGLGLLIQGTRDWRDYRVSADVTPHLAEAAGLGARVQGMERGYVLELIGRDRVRLLRRWHGETELAITSYGWEYGTTYQLTLEVDGSGVRGWVDDRLVADIVDDDTRLGNGAVALTVRDGRTATTMVSVRPVEHAITRT